MKHAAKWLLGIATISLCTICTVAFSRLAVQSPVLKCTIVDIDDIQTVFLDENGTYWAINHSCYDASLDQIDEPVMLFFAGHDTSTDMDDEITAISYTRYSEMVKEVNWDVDYTSYRYEEAPDV